MYCRYIGPEEKLKFAYDKILLTAFEEDIPLKGDSLIPLFVDRMKRMKPLQQMYLWKGTIMSKAVKKHTGLKKIVSFFMKKKLPAFGYYLLLGIVFLLAFVVFWSIKTPKVYMIHSSGVVQSSNKNYVMSLL
jgi:hypothetical protein